MFSTTPRLHSTFPSALHHPSTWSASKMSYDTNERQNTWGLISDWFSHLSCSLLWMFFAVPRCLLSLLDEEALSFFSLKIFAQASSQFTELQNYWTSIKCLRKLRVKSKLCHKRQQIWKAESLEGWMGCVSSCMANDSFGREVRSKHTRLQPRAAGSELELL